VTKVTENGEVRESGRLPKPTRLRREGRPLDSTTERSSEWTGEQGRAPSAPHHAQARRKASDRAGTRRSSGTGGQKGGPGGAGGRSGELSRVETEEGESEYGEVLFKQVGIVVSESAFE
jgi:hypothetical protein